MLCASGKNKDHPNNDRSPHANEFHVFSIPDFFRTRVTEIMPRPEPMSAREMPRFGEVEYFESEDFEETCGTVVVT